MTRQILNDINYKRVRLKSDWLPFNKEHEVKWDLFICHASEDKDDFVRPLAEELISRGLRVWYDDFSLEVGDSLRRSIDEGLAKSKYGIVVLSPSFFIKEWPQKELDGLVSRERDGIKVILPIWHKVEFNYVVKHSPILADRIAAKSSEGIDKVTEKILRAIEKKNGSTVIDSSKYYRDLSEEEVDVLISALNNQGIINIIETDQTGSFLQIAERDFIENDNPEVRISYLEALKKLIEYGLVFQENERLFNLSKSGFQYAKNLEINTLMEKAWHYYENEKNNTESIRLYQKIVEKYPESGIAREAQKMIGVNYLHLDDSANAELELKKCIDMGNEFSSAFFYYGEALLKNKKYRKAKKAFESSLSKRDIPDWINIKAPEKIKLCVKEVIPGLASLADKKYEIERTKINTEIEIKENNIREQRGMQGLCWSSVLAREILDVNLKGAKKKIELRLELDKDIIFSSQPIKSDEDISFLYKRLEATADFEKKAIKEKIDAVYKECHVDSFLELDKGKIDQEIDLLLKEKHIDLNIEKEKA